MGIGHFVTRIRININCITIIGTYGVRSPLFFLFGIFNALSSFAWRGRLAFTVSFFSIFVS